MPEIIDYIKFDYEFIWGEKEKNNYSEISGCNKIRV